MLYLFFMDWRMAIVALLPFPGFFLFLRHAMKASSANMQGFVEKLGRLNSATVEFVSGIPVVKAFGSSGQAHGGYSKAVDGFADAFLNFARPLVARMAHAHAMIAPVTVLGVVLIFGALFSYLDWMAREFSWRGLMDGVPVNHLWFIVYIAAYSAVTILLWRQPGLIQRIGDWLEQHLRGWRVLVLPILYLIFIRIALFPYFGLTNTLTVDWYNHALSLVAFVFGFAIVGRESIWRDMERLRWVSVTLAAVALPIMMAQVWHPGGRAFWGVPKAIVYGIDQWAVITAILGFGSLYLRDRSSPVLKYLTEATFPLYLAHQTVLVIAVWIIRPANLSAPVELLSLVLITFLGSLAIYEVVKRIPFIRPLWGLKPLDDKPWPIDLRPEARTPYRRRRHLLGVGVAAPVIALLVVAVAIAAYPDFNNATQYLSELGGATARKPMIFNAGLFDDGAKMGRLAEFYAKAIVASGMEFDMVFGPAYKGISLAALTAAKLSELATARGLPDAEKWNKIEYAYNRKEKKDHGEGGVIVGSALAGKKVLIIDDVITAGTAIKEAFSIIENEKATVAGVLLALDRQETTVDNTKQSAVQIISKTFNVPVISIVDILDIIKFLDGKLSAEEIEKVKEYRQKYAPENL